MNRPSIPPLLLSQLTAQAPSRWLKKLDATPPLADSWAFTLEKGGCTVLTDSGETVTVSSTNGVLGSLSDVSCTCLLSPRCLHVLAVAVVLPVLDASGDPAPEETEDISSVTEIIPPFIKNVSPSSSVPISPAQQEAASSCLNWGGHFLQGGIPGCGAVLQGELARCIHSSRVHKLPRLSLAGQKLLLGIRALRENASHASMETLCTDLREWLLVSLNLTGAEGDSIWLGEARRTQREIGSLSLHGLASEPLPMGPGFAAVRTWMVDPQGRLFTLTDVLPQEKSISNAYLKGTRLPGLSLSHRDLCRSGLYLASATASEDGRLGMGARVQAAPAPKVGWGEPPLLGLFQEPLTSQCHRAFSSLIHPPESRPAGADLLFLTGRITGAHGDALLFQPLSPGESSPPLLHLRASPPLQDSSSSTLALLARSPGMALRGVARVDPHHPASAFLLAFSPLPEDADSPGPSPSPRLHLPPAHAERFNVGLDAPTASWWEGLEPGRGASATSSGETASLLPTSLQRLGLLLRRLLGGGVAALTSSPLSTHHRLARELEGDLLPTAAAGLLHLCMTLGAASRRLTGETQKARPKEIALAWLTAWVVYQEICKALYQQEWMGGESS